MRKGRLVFMMITSLLAITSCGGSEQESGGGGGAVVSSLRLNYRQATLSVGDTLQLVCTGQSEEDTLQWTSSNKEVATVSNGLVTANKNGDAVITVKVVGTSKRASCAITVSSGGGGQQFITNPTEINIKTTFNDTYGEIFKSAAASLMAKEPNLKINYEKYNGSYTDLKDDIVKGIPAGNYPDVTVVYPDSVADFIVNGVQLNMEPYMFNEDYGWTEEEYSDFYTTYLDEGRHYSISGTYSLPLAKSTEGMYYSDKLIGLTLPGVNGGNALTENYFNNLTWEELFENLCPALWNYRESLGSEDLKKAFLDTTTYSDWAIVGYDSDDNLFITLAEQYGYGYTEIDPDSGNGLILFDNPEMKAKLKIFNEAYQKHYFTTKGIIGTNVNYRSNADAMLFSIGSTGGVGYQFSSENPKNMKVARIPQAAGSKKAKLIQQGPSITVLNHNDSDRALASWLFYKELTSYSNCIKWTTTTGYSPIRLSVAQSSEFLEYSNASKWDELTVDHLRALNAEYQLMQSNSLFSSPVFKGSSEARTQVGGLVTSVVSMESWDDASVDSLFETAVENVIIKMS